jgi:predicted amidohydrolase
MIVFPENVLFRGNDSGFRRSASNIPGSVTRQLSMLSRRFRMAAVWGGLVERADDRLFNTSVFFDEQGRLRAAYRKMHLFELYDGRQVCFRESALFAHGADIVTVRHHGLVFGLSICYDVRFPELYREQVRRGASVLLVPSDFTRRTGRLHWLPLLRARAIENLSYVIAPNQCGHNPETGALSHGHTCGISPWGTVLGELRGDAPGLVFCEVDARVVADSRQRIRALRHRRVASTL